MLLADHVTLQGAPLPPNEAARIKALQQLVILDTPPEQQFDDMAQMAAAITACPIALVSLIDINRQWFKAKCGLDTSETDRGIAFCAYAILGNDLFEVPDATEDPRFAANPLVTGSPGIRFYAGMPLVSKSGFAYGTLCVINTRPGKLNAFQRQAMERLARQVVWCMEARLQHEQDIGLSKSLTSLLEFLPDGLITIDIEGNIKHVNSIARRWHGVDPATVSRQEWSNYFELYEASGKQRLQFSENPLSKVLRGEMVKDQEVVIRSKGQHDRLVLCNADFLRDDQGHRTGAVVVLRDITANREASRSIADKNRRLSGILEGTRAGTWECNLVSGAVELNERWAEIIGHRLEDLSAFTLDMLDRWVHPDDVELCRETLQQHLRGELQLYDVSMRMRHKYGHYVWVHDIGRVFEWGPMGQPLKMAGTRLDISAMKQRDAEVASARNYLQELINAAEDVSIIATDTQGMITLFNAGAEHMLGYVARDMVGKQTPAIFHLPKQVEQRAKELSRQYDRNINGFETFVHEARNGRTDTRQWTFICRDGSLKQVRLSVSALHDGQGRVVGFLGMAMDLTRQLEAEESARVSIERFERAFAAAAQGMALLSVTGRWIDVNNALCQMFGYPREELLKLALDQLTYAEDLNKDLQLVRKTLDGEINHYQLEKRYIDSSGTIIHGILSVSLVRDTRGWPMHFVLQIQDITALKHMETMKDEFVSTVSHELRTPLTSISGALGLIRGGVLGEVPEAMQEMLAVAGNNALRLSALINDLLDMEKLVAGKMNFVFTEMPLVDVLDEAVAAMESYATPLGITIWRIGTAPVRVSVDPMRLLQVLANLLSNACKFSPKGAEVKLEHRLVDNKVEVSVIDQGAGIAESFRERIFQKFSQADAGTARSKGGTGLGLVICKELIERMHGEIGYESGENKGSRFWFRLPVL